MIIKTLEAELRREEAKLSMLRKLRISQQHSVKQVLFKLIKAVILVIIVVTVIKAI